MSELVKTARAGRCLPSPSRLVIRVSWTPGTEALGMWRYGGNRSSDEETPCLLFISPTARPTPGGGGLFEAYGLERAGERGSGDEYDDLMFFSPVGLIFSICYGLFAL